MHDGSWALGDNVIDADLLLTGTKKASAVGDRQWDRHKSSAQWDLGGPVHCGMLGSASGSRHDGILWGKNAGPRGPCPLPSTIQIPLHSQPSPASLAAPTLLSPGAGAPGLGQTCQGRGPELHPSAGPRRSLAGQEPAADGQDEAGVRKEAEGMGGG